jgi:hypothetical protein
LVFLDFANRKILAGGVSKIKAAHTTCWVHGAILEFGRGDKFRALFDEVQLTNMSKACDTIAKAAATIGYYKAKSSAYYCQQDGDKCLIYRISDNITLKYVACSPTDLAGIVNG